MRTILVWCAIAAMCAGSARASSADQANPRVIAALTRARDVIKAETPDDVASIALLDRLVKDLAAGSAGDSKPALKPSEADSLIEKATALLRQLQQRQREEEDRDKQERFETALKAIESVLQELHALEIVPKAEDPKLQKNPLTRMTIGFEQSALAGKDLSSRFVADFAVAAPFGPNHRVTLPNDSCGTKLETVDVGSRSQVWGRVRLNSEPQQVNAALSAVDIPKTVLELKTNQTVQGLEYVFGYELRLWNGHCFASAVPNTMSWFSVSFIAGGGATTPLVHTSEIGVFKFDPATRAQKLPPEFDEAKAKADEKDSKIQFVALAPPDRRTLFAQYWLGFRFKTDLLDTAKGNRVAFPGVIDITVGKNEAITGGEFANRWVGKIDAFYPIPIAASKSFYLFGSTTLQLNQRRTGDEPSPLLNPVTDKTPPAEDIFILHTAADRRDIWKIGAGVDLLQLFKPKS